MSPARPLLTHVLSIRAGTDEPLTAVRSGTSGFRGSDRPKRERSRACPWRSRPVPPCRPRFWHAPTL